ncbi:MAG: TatD family hydrolase [Candidatus Bathyarchaeota archaeon]|nr:TatD family hydrolase [Candidatus Bathyarchaeota archaeon]
MKLVDAHIHLSDKEYAEHTEELIADAKNANVAALVSNSMDLETSIDSLRLAEKYPDVVYPALGIHPWNVNVLKENELEETLRLISEQHEKKRVAAIGEIGLDYKYETIWAKQLMVFDKMLHLAEQLTLPVIIHSRGTTTQIVEMLPSYNVKRVLLHWFSHPMNALYKAIDHDYFITDGPPAAYSNGIREVVKKVPLTNFLTETDGPVIYRKPPFNGQLTKPSFIRTVIEAVAEVKQITVHDVAEQIAKNFEHFFNIKLA